MKLQYIGWILCITLSMTAYASQDNLKIKGYVLQKENGSPLGFATITLDSTSLGTISDEKGYFEINIPKQGEYIVRANFMGYREATQRVNAEKETSIQIELSPESIQMEQIVVTGNQGEYSRKNAPALINTISARQLDNIGATNLAEGLNLSSGLRVETTCQNCSFPQVRINGLDGMYSQIVIDSKPVVSSLAGVYALEQIPANMIERIEIIRGGGSSVFGGNAIAGIVNVITREPRENSAAGSSSYYNLYGKASEYTVNANVSLVGKNQKSALALFGNYRRRDPLDIDGDGFSELGKIKSNSFGLNGYIKSGETGKFSFEYKNIAEFRRGGNNFSMPPHMSDITEQTEHDINNASVAYDQRLRDGKMKLSVYGALQHIFRDSYYGSDNDENAYGKTSDVTTLWGARLTNKIGRFLFSPALLSYGAEYKYNGLHDRMPLHGRQINQQVHLSSLFLENTWNGNKLSVTAGGRFDKHSLINKPLFAPRMNLMYKPSQKVTFRAAYSNGYRAPEAFDEDLHVSIVGGEPMIIVLDPDLKAERSHSYSLSGDFYLGEGDWKANLLTDFFYTDIRHVFILQPIGQQGDAEVMQKRNGDGARVAGINMDLTLFYKSLLQIQLGFTAQKSQYTAPYQWSENPQTAAVKKMFRSPNTYGFVSVMYTPTPLWNFSANLVYTGSMLVQHFAGYIESDRIEKTPEFFDVGLKLSRDFNVSEQVKIELHIGAKNLLNSYQKDFDQGSQRDSKYIYGPSLPRTFFAGVKIKL